MEERKLNSNYCDDCGKIFYSKGKIKICLCDDCKKARIARKISPKKKIFKGKSIEQVTREFEQYNKENGTCLTYGQYELLTKPVESGTIKPKASAGGETKFVIDYPEKKTEWTKEYGLNQYYSGKHWARRQADAEYWHELTGVCAQGLPMLEKPCIITFYFNDGLDISNHAAIAKMIEDGLKGRVIHDDNRKWVKGHEYYFHDEDYILVELREVQNGDCKYPD